MLPDLETPFGARVRERLGTERIIWFSTVGADGTPQPNPVWFLWHEDSVLIYNLLHAKRLAHIEARPRVSLHFNSTQGGGDVVVFTGTARRLEGHPRPHEMPEYLAKYGEDMKRVSGDEPAFGARYPVAVRIGIEGVRGF
ncbi:TIGR03667 family PPOX class F420-dependent oxidoreductase [Amycolatopsis alkalitolerans]|uniref:TIGR03667 family PPOX class F420-dependent oxidoreductase n=1 Tax=Amycolatopsis alkalitolerans TaxID=2547244 RepID=A0A5C4LNZ9_9PSEU|nr:TIGR03667 family PPOX class F420-dependent oxidoreductase [Amycolatopsis alkalitolerans]TNC18842.1 TIGR03667 family PPOX class F420-dependent oxidoreductase [Amycolatopsis alkalitolerans]